MSYKCNFFCTFLVLAAILVTDIRSILVRTYTHCLHYRHTSTIYCIIRTRQGDAYRRQCTMCPFPHPHTRHAPELRAAQTRQLPASYCSTPRPCMHILFIARFYGACGPLMPSTTPFHVFYRVSDSSVPSCVLGFYWLGVFKPAGPVKPRV